MADLIDITSNAYGAGIDARDHGAPDLITGDLRRRYDFGNTVSDFGIAQDVFFRFVSKVSKKSVDDPQFKFTERRPSFHKRYAYVTAHGALSAATTDNATMTAGEVESGDTYYFKMGTDYKSTGNITNIYGQDNNEITVGDANTKPQFFLPGQIVKINYRGEDEGTAFTTPTGYLLAKVITVTDVDTTHVILQTEIVKGVAGAKDLMWASATAAVGQTYNLTIHDDLEPKRCYVVGTVHDKGTGFPETWEDQPFSTSYGQTQIWKTAMAMDNTDRATVLKYEANEWGRIWKEKLIEHKWDIEQSLLFGSYNADYRTTEGAVNFISNYGNVFSLDTATKTQDDFLDDMSSFLDPRYNNANATLFFVDTATYNWLHKLSGYFTNNLESSPNFRSEMSLSGKKKAFGVDITTITTPHGDMNVVRNIHLDGSDIKILAINMKYCSYRPLVGNGINRDTAVYVGVQTLENTGVDRRVDLIQTEAGMEWQMPEAHAYWS
ncbi:MAG: DUF5309 family protein [Candidatus Brocadiales bacterium]|nr:DUF5309 family protein [Candidatus Brocadiales bacterium]